MLETGEKTNAEAQSGGAARTRRELFYGGRWQKNVRESYAQGEKKKTQKGTKTPEHEGQN